MDIFISWHGKRSHAAAEALRGWLPLIVNAFKPWLSSADIDKGARWRTELAAKLSSVTAGIFCLTPSNLTASWLIYEAGAISRTPEKTYVCTLLIDLQPSDVTDPLAQFQATKATKEDIHQLVKNLNKALGEQSMDEALVNRAFEKWWPDLEKELKNLPPDEAAPPPQRPEREMLQELLDKVRDLSQNLRPRTRSYRITPTGELIPSIAGETVELGQDWRNYLVPPKLDPETARNALAANSLAAIYKKFGIKDAADIAATSAGFENAAEFNRALQCVADVVREQTRVLKKDATESEGKPPEAPKSADPPTTAKEKLS